MKDPALLWYFSDWTSGTMLLNMHQKGCYMTLLAAQFNNGPLTLEEIKSLLGSDFGQWPNIQKKFTFMDGRYYNQRLEDEKNKRSKYTSSRRKNLSSHMEDINENRNVNVIKNTYGEFKNVLLTDQEHGKLVENIGEINTHILIEELSTGIASKGYKYKSHYATILNWARRKVSDHRSKLQGKERTIA